jgi:predicted  nucleic acid-binding Zn-ribbon protein
MINERERLRLYDRLGEVIGPTEAGILMELLPPTSWDDIATRQQLEATNQRIDNAVATIGADLRVEMAELRTELRGEMAELRTELRGEMAGLRTELQGEMAELRGDMAGLQGDMAGLRGELELALARNLRFQVAANFASMLALAGFIVGLG